MQMRPVDAASRPGQSDWVTPCKILAFRHLNFAQVCIIGKNAQAVVHNNDVARIKQVPGQPDDSGIGYLDRSAGTGTQVNASVIAAMLAVEQPASAKSAGRITHKRLFETSVPQAGVVAVCINALDLLFLTRHAL